MSWLSRNSLQNDNSLMRRKSYDHARRHSIDNRARSSIGPSAVKRRSSSEERKSNNFPNLNGPRRSSLLNEVKLLKDPRPLKDKSYQQRKITELIEFLQETSFASPLSPQRLMEQPTKKDFENIFQHLINFWDDEYVVKRIEEEAPKLLKSLNYPFLPEKPTIFAYVKRNNWPYLLGILVFLMEIIKSASKFNPEVLLTAGKENEVPLQVIFSFRNENEEEVQKVLTELIREMQIPYDVNELSKMNAELKSRLETIQEDIAKLDYMINLCQQQDIDIKKYEDFFERMKERKQKRVESIKKLSEDLAAKEAELSGLIKIRDQKQETYDAQGFDGKKQVLYFEEQKKELLEKLQEKKDARKNIKQQCWEAEMQYAKTLDKGTSVSESFNELYSSVSRKSNQVLSTLQDIQDPQVKSLCASMNVIFPDCEMKPMQNVFSQGPNVKAKLEEIQNKIEYKNVFFKSLLSKQSQILSENEMKVTELSLAIKVAAAQETQKARELSSNKEQAKKNWKELETKYEETLKLWEKLRTERMKVDDENKELLEELHNVENIKKQKQEMLNDYLKEQKELFVRYAKAVEDAEKMSENYGNEVFEAVQKNCRKSP